MSLIHTVNTVNTANTTLNILPLLLINMVKNLKFNHSDESVEATMSETMYEMCKCGHKGGHSPYNNEHMDRFQQGHGYCKYVNCECTQFTWVGFCDSEGRLN